MKRSGLYFVVSMIAAFAFMIGCGSATDDLEVSHIPSNVNITIAGYVTDGSNRTCRASSEMRYSLGSLEGITVFLEDNPLLSGITDANGRYVIANVPRGKHSLVAKTSIGNQTYKMILPDINVSGNDGSYMELPQTTQSISIQPAPYSLTLTVTDTKGNPLGINSGLKVNLWGQDYSPDNNKPGVIKLVDFPGVNTKAKITANNYKTAEIPVTFGENYNSEIFVKLQQTTENTNLAPIVSITYDSDSSTIYKDNNDVLTINPNRNLYLTANGYDAEGDSISYSWAATSGNITSISYNRATFIATQTYTNVIITLTGTDNRQNVGKAELALKVYGGTIATTTPDPYNPPLATYTPDPATGTPDP